MAKDHDIQSAATTPDPATLGSHHLTEAAWSYLENVFREERTKKECDLLATKLTELDVLLWRLEGYDSRP